MRRLAGNIASLLTSTVFERAMRFVLYAMVARSLGAEDLGRLGLAIAVFQIISRFALAGIPALTTRSIAQDRDERSSIVINGGAAVTGTSIVGYGVLIAFMSIVGYGPETTAVIWLLFTGLVVFCWSKVLEAALVGLELAKYIAAVTVPVNLIQTVLAFLLLRAGFGIGAITLTIAASYGVIALALLVVLVMRAGLRRPHLRLRVQRSMLRESLPFLGIDGTTVVRASSNAIIISVILGEVAVGIYTAAIQLQIPLRLVGNAVGTGVFPVLVRAYERGTRMLAAVTSRAVELTIAVVLPGVVGLQLLGGELVDLIYQGAEFEESITVLELLAWAALAMAVSSVLGRALVAALREVLTFRIALVNTILQLTLAVALTQRFGVVGAAYASVAAAIVNIIQHYVPMRRLVGRLSVWGVLWKPIVASAAMGVVLLALPDIHVIVATVIGAVTYGIAYTIISIVAAGGTSEFRRSLSVEGALRDREP